MGAFLPWVTANAAFVGRIEKNGIEGDGKLTLLAAIVIGAIAWTQLREGRGSRSSVVAGLVFSALAAAAAGWDLIDINRRVKEVNATMNGMGIASTGVGLYLTMAGTIAMVVGCVMALQARPGKS
jgi:hypothetical protein